MNPSREGLSKREPSALLLPAAPGKISGGDRSGGGSIAAKLTLFFPIFGVD